MSKNTNGHLSIQLERYTKLWICCGGIGAAPMINILMQLHERVMQNDMKLNQLKDVHFVWETIACKSKVEGVSKPIPKTPGNLATLDVALSFGASRLSKPLSYSLSYSLL